MNDELLIEGLEKASHKKWLGSWSVVNSLLRTCLNDVLGAGHVDGDSLAAGADKASKKVAKILLGQDPDFPGPDWNSPGKIDVHVANQEGVESDDPEERVAGGLVNMIDDVWTMIGDSVEHDLLDEQWLTEVNEVVRRYACVMMGLPQSGYTQDAMETSNSRIKPSPFAKA